MGGRGVTGRHNLFGFPESILQSTTSKTNTQVKITWYGKQHLIKWIEQWLTDRRQRVVVDGEVSSRESVLRGVPHDAAGHKELDDL